MHGSSPSCRRSNTLAGRRGSRTFLRFPILVNGGAVSPVHVGGIPNRRQYRFARIWIRKSYAKTRKDGRYSVAIGRRPSAPGVGGPEDGRTVALTVAEYELLRRVSSERNHTGATPCAPSSEVLDADRPVLRKSLDPSHRHLHDRAPILDLDHEIAAQQAQPLDRSAVRGHLGQRLAVPVNGSPSRSSRPRVIPDWTQKGEAGPSSRHGSSQASRSNRAASKSAAAPAAAPCDLDPQRARRGIPHAHAGRGMRRAAAAAGGGDARHVGNDCSFTPSSHGTTRPVQTANRVAEERRLYPRFSPSRRIDRKPFRTTAGQRPPPPTPTAPARGLPGAAYVKPGNPTILQ